MGRAPALVGLFLVLGLYDALAERLPELGEWGTVAFFALVLIPLTFLVAWLALAAPRGGRASRTFSA